MDTMIVEDPTNAIRDWVFKNDGTCLWQEQIGNGRIDCYQVKNEEGTPKVFLVQRFQGDVGYEVYTPATRSIRQDDTLAALNEWLAA